MSAPQSESGLRPTAKGWTWDETLYILTKPTNPFYVRDVAEALGEYETTHWINLDGEPAIRPDYVGTLGGVAWMMRGLNEAGRRCSWSYNIHTYKYVCIEDTEFFDDDLIAESPDDRPGDCVGDAWLSMFGKEAADAS